MILLNQTYVAAYVIFSLSIIGMLVSVILGMLADSRKKSADAEKDVDSTCQFSLEGSDGMADIMQREATAPQPIKRVLRVLEYIGTDAWVTEQLERRSIKGIMTGVHRRLNEGVIREAILGPTMELLTASEVVNRLTGQVSQSQEGAGQSGAIQGPAQAKELKTNRAELMQKLAELQQQEHERIKFQEKQRAKQQTQADLSYTKPFPSDPKDDI